MCYLSIIIIYTACAHCICHGAHGTDPSTGAARVVHAHAAHPAPPIGRPATGARLRESYMPVNARYLSPQTQPVLDFV